MTKNYLAPKVVRMTNMNKAEGACSSGSGNVSDCMFPGISAGGVCVVSGNAAAANCDPMGNSF